MNVNVCGVPGVSVSVVGATVTPAGSPDTDTLTVPLNPFSAVAVTAVPCPSAPAVNVKLIGLIANVKSATAAAVTFNVNVAECTSAPEVPVTVMVLDPATALAAAVTVSVCGVPGVIVGVDGLTETPAGSPLTTIPTPALNPFTPLNDTAVDPVAPPAVTFTVVGFSVSEKSCTAAAAIVSVNVAVCNSPPEVPVTVIVLDPAFALAAAVNVIACDPPAAIVGVAGLAVTPAGRPLTAIPTPALNPFTAPTETVVAPVAPPAVALTVPGLTVSVKSGGGTAVTLTATVALCTRDPDVPVIVTIPELVGADAAAVNLIVCVAPGVIITDDGLAVTPAGSPAVVTAISALYPFTAVVVTMTCCVDPFAVSATLAGAVANVKSSSNATLDPHPPAVSAKKLSTNARHPNRQPNFFPNPRVKEIMRLPPIRSEPFTSRRR